VGTANIPIEAWVIALAALPGVGPSRLRWLLTQGEPEAVWRRVCSGSLKKVVNDESLRIPPAFFEQCSVAAKSMDPVAFWNAHIEAGIGVMTRWSASFPAELADDDDAPVVLFWLGDIDRLAGTRVAIVGTRRATRYGIDVANEFALRMLVRSLSMVLLRSQLSEAALTASTRERTARYGERWPNVVLS